MSDIRIGLIAEGDTDSIVIEAALRAILDRPFILTTIQPDFSIAFDGNYGPNGGGWPGVYKWCRQIVSMGYNLDKHPSLSSYDLLIIHIDADVASKNYSDANITDMPRNNLPCEKKCPPPSDTVAELTKVLFSWLNINTSSALPGHWKICMPSKCIEAWVIAAKYHGSANQILHGLECNNTLAKWLSQRPKREGERLVKGNKKIKNAYRNMGGLSIERWQSISKKCTTAKSFSSEIQTWMRSHDKQPAN